MILWGWHTNVLKQVEPKDMKCPICSHQGNIVIFLMCRIYHFFFIPFFPDNRYIHAICKQCGEEIHEVDVEKEDRKPFRTKSYREHVPIKAWMGTFILLLIIIYLSLK